jgi:hypothetical protein
MSASKCMYLREVTPEVMSLLLPFSNASLLPSCAVSSISNGRYASEQDMHTIAMLMMNDRRRRKKPSQNTLRSPCLKAWVFPNFMSSGLDVLQIKLQGHANRSGLRPNMSI